MGAQCKQVTTVWCESSLWIERRRGIICTEVYSIKKLRIPSSLLRQTLKTHNRNSILKGILVNDAGDEECAKQKTVFCSYVRLYDFEWRAEWKFLWLFVIRRYRLLVLMIIVQELHLKLEIRSWLISESYLRDNVSCICLLHRYNTFFSKSLVNVVCVCFNTIHYVLCVKNSHLCLVKNALGVLEAKYICFCG